MTAARFEVDDWGAFETTPSSGLLSVFRTPGPNSGLSGLDDWQSTGGSRTLSQPSASGSFESHTTQNIDLDCGLSAPAPKPIESRWTHSLLDPLEPGLADPKRHDEDDFGEFVSPNTWTEEGKGPDTLAWGEEQDEGEVSKGLWLEDGPTSVHPWPEDGKGKPLDNPLVSQLWPEDGKGADSQSVSSLELPGLEHAWDAVGEWRRCLQSCLGILQFAVDTFDALSESRVLAEVLASERGRCYLRDLVEVWFICERIATSYHKTGLDQKIDALLNSTTTMWSLLKPHYNQAMIPVASDLTSSGPAMCSVCLADGASVDFEGHSYHPPCANLWLNNIDTALPALHQP